MSTHLIANMLKAAKIGNQARQAALMRYYTRMDARELVSLIQLDSCPRRLGLAKAQKKPADIREHFSIATRDISVFAAENGRKFENRLIAKEAAYLRKLYAREDPDRRSLTIAEEDVSVLSANDKAVQTAKEKLALNRGLIVQARLHFQFAGMDITLEPDVLVWDEDQAQWRVGEIKSYAYDGRLTDPKKAASAAAQAAFSIIALRQLGYPVCETDVDLIFTVAREYNGKRFTDAKLRSIGVTDVLHGIEALERRLAAANPVSLDDAEAVAIKPCDACQVSCPLWEHCGKELTGRRAVWGIAPAIANDIDETMDDLGDDADVAFAQQLLNES